MGKLYRWQGEITHTAKTTTVEQAADSTERLTDQEAWQHEVSQGQDGKSSQAGKQN
jgi:hypothetical protein